MLIPVFWCPFFNFLVNKCHYTDKGKYDKRNDLNLNVWFTDPFLALEHFKINHSTYSLVISDLRMPSMSGFQFIQNIKLIRPKINVLLMSAFDVIGDSEFSTHSSEYEIDGFLQKPISIKKLNSIIKSYMMKN